MKSKIENKHLRAGRAILCGLAYGLCSRPEHGRGTGCLLLDEVIESDQPLELPQHVVILNRNHEHYKVVFLDITFTRSFG